MGKTVIRLPDGQEISSGAPGQAVLSSVLTCCVNSEADLKLGSCCTAMAELTVLNPPELKEGMEVTLLYEQEDGSRKQDGIFILQKPEKTGGNTLRLTAYDRMILLDQDLTDWVEGLSDWPYPLYDFCRMVCDRCGVVLLNETLPNGSFPVQRFSAQGITGRKILSWGAEAAGLYVRATPEGMVEFTWYTPAEISVYPTWRTGSAVYREETLLLSGASGVLTQGELSVSGLEAAWEDGVLMAAFPKGCWYFQNGLTALEFVTHPIEKVQISATSSDVGVIWPEAPVGTNTYRVEGNLLLSALRTQDLIPVAQVLYDRLKEITYTPCQVTVPDTADVTAGQILSIQDSSGKMLTVYVMTARRSGGQLVLGCTGNQYRDSTTVVNNQSYKALSGRVMELQMDLEGLRAEHRDALGSLARVELTLDGVRSQVEKQGVGTEGVDTRLSELEQTAEQLRLEFSAIESGGVEKVQTASGFTFNDQGLHIQKSGEAVANRMDHTGMYVTRSDSEILVANKEGVQATDLTARNFLIIGSHARFQDYGCGRTACFYIN